MAQVSRLSIQNHVCSNGHRMRRHLTCCWLTLACLRQVCVRPKPQTEDIMATLAFLYTFNPKRLPRSQKSQCTLGPFDDDTNVETLCTWSPGVAPTQIGPLPRCFCQRHARRSNGRTLVNAGQLLRLNQRFQGRSPTYAFLLQA